MATDWERLTYGYYGEVSSNIWPYSVLVHFHAFCPSPVPKVKMMDDRLGPLVQEFKDLVYPADYNPEGKPSAKRKLGEGSCILETK